MGCARDIAVFDVGDVAIGEDVAEAVGDAEGVGAWPHAVDFDKVVPFLAGGFNPLAAVPIFEFGDGVAMVANLHGRPPLITAILEMIDKLRVKTDIAVLDK